MRYAVPFVPDPAYMELLVSHRDRLTSVYFRLGPEVPDGRMPGIGDASPQDIMEGLSALPGVRRYGLLNSRFYDPAALSREGLSDLIILLEGYLAADVLDGIVYADHYLLVALSDAAPEVAKALEAIPSVNFLMDCAQRAGSLIDYAASTHFRPPRQVVLDRSLNRDMTRLAAVARELRSAYEGISVGLLANEGCLYACPFKAAHDGRIALSRLVPQRVGPGVKEQIGCLRFFLEDLGRIFASPFLRPEDASRLEGTVDFLKLGGRTRDPAVLREVVAAYLRGNYQGNLLALLDTLEALSDRYWVENTAIPETFFTRVDGCSRRCRDCGYCAALAGELVRERALVLPEFVDA